MERDAPRGTSRRSSPPRCPTRAPRPRRATSRAGRRHATSTARSPRAPRTATTPPDKRNESRSRRASRGPRSDAPPAGAPFRSWRAPGQSGDPSRRNRMNPGNAGASPATSPKPVARRCGRDARVPGGRHAEPAGVSGHGRSCSSIFHLSRDRFGRCPTPGGPRRSRGAPDRNATPRDGAMRKGPVARARAPAPRRRVCSATGARRRPPPR